MKCGGLWASEVSSDVYRWMLPAFWLKPPARPKIRELLQSKFFFSPGGAVRVRALLHRPGGEVWSPGAEPRKSRPHPPFSGNRIEEGPHFWGRLLWLLSWGRLQREHRLEGRWQRPPSGLLLLLYVSGAPRGRRSFHQAPPPVGPAKLGGASGGQLPPSEPNRDPSPALV